MLQNRSQKPISPQQMFQRLLGQSYRQSQCEDKSQKLKKQRQVLIELIQQYQRRIEEQLIRVNQHENLERLRIQKLNELERLKRQRDIVEQSVSEEMAEISVKQDEQQQKMALIAYLHQVRSINQSLRLKVRDLLQYVKKLENHNRTLQNQKDLVHTKMATRLRVHSEDWRQNIQQVQRRQQNEEMEYRAKVLEKEAEQMKNVRKQEQEIWKRNQARWQQFRKAAYNPSIMRYNSGTGEDLKSFISRRLPQRNFQRFRVI